MSTQFKNLIADLQGNMEVVGRFFDDPLELFQSYGISESEGKTLLSRNLDDLNALGLTKQEAVGALSGAHSSGCNAPI